MYSFFQIIFTMTLKFQGTFIFLFHCVRVSDLRRVWLIRNLLRQKNTDVIRIPEKAITRVEMEKSENTNETKKYELPY